MHLATLDVDRTEARTKFLEYKRSVKERHDAEEAQIMRGYREIARGRQVIDIVATIRAGGVVAHENRHWNGRVERCSLPALAVMRADQPWCFVQTTTDGRVTFTNEHARDMASNARRNVVRLPDATIAGTDTHPLSSWVHARAMVPPVPPALRPTIALGNFHVLFEAEWEPVAPKDPALLRHLGGDLYAVLAVWDLTELERTVLAGRFR